MTPFRRLARRLRHLFRRRQTEAEMREEMSFHLEQRAADYAADGLPAEEARYAAQRRFGNAGSLQERARETWGWGWLERAFKDFRLAWRQLAGNPGFTLLAIVTLALGIGANTAMFSILDGILFKPLPYPDSAQLERIYRATPQTNLGNLSPAGVADFLRVKRTYADAAAYTIGESSLSEPGHPAEMVSTIRVTANLLVLLGLPPQLGRDFRPEEAAPGRDRVVLLSHRIWLGRFGGAPGIIGRTIRIDGEPHEVIGVLPEALNDGRHLGGIDFYRPLAFSQEQRADRTSTTYRILLRRFPGHSRTEVAGIVAGFGARQAAAFPAVNAESTWRTVALLDTIFDSNGATMLSMLIGLSALVLLIACSNLANLLLARTMARAREFAVRSALGASRTQLLRPLVAESLLLALAGGVCAILIAFWFRDYMTARSTDDNGAQIVFVLGWRVFAWTFGASLATALAFGLAPALYALRLDLNQTLKSGGRGTTGGRGHQRFRHVLIIGQFAVAMVLLAGAGIFIRGLYELNNRRAGWTSEHLVTGTLLLPAGHYADTEKITAFHRLALQRLAALPGVASVSLSSFTPFFAWTDIRKFIVEGQERPKPGHEPAAAVNGVSPGYFDTFGTRVLAGRGFDEHDTAASPKVFLLGESTARALFGRENPLGRRLAIADGASPRWGEIVGIVKSVEPAVAEPNPVFNQVYQPLAQEPRPQTEIAVRMTGAIPVSLEASIRTTMAELDPDLPVRNLKAADAAIVRANYRFAVLRDMLSAMALLGLGLASLGIYGIIARTMAQRAGEFAIRLALGASIENVTRLVLASGVKLALIGSTLGLLGAFGLSRLLAATITGIHLDGTAVLAGTTLLLVAVALIACWLPARRAGRVDAMSVLRAE